MLLSASSLRILPFLSELESVKALVDIIEVPVKFNIRVV
jgi:hypothetical protein